MDLENSSKLNCLLGNWVPGTIVTTAILRKYDISAQLAYQYVKSGWIERIGSGAFKRPGDQLDWTGAIHTLQTQCSVAIYPAAMTALELLGLSHNLILGDAKVNLMMPASEVVPTWFKRYNWNVDISIRRRNLFLSCTDGLITLRFKQGYEIRLSAPERAMIELCDMIPSKQSFEEARNVMQGLLTLRPPTVQVLLESCRSIKAKRVFLYLADTCNMPWFERLRFDKIDLGSGKRQVVRSGRLDARYQITVPVNDSELELGGIP